MKFASAIKQLIRASLENPSTSLANPASWLLDWAGGGITSAGARVNNFTAMQQVWIWACINLLAKTFATLPLVTYQRLVDSSGKSLGRRECRKNPLYKMLRYQFNPFMSSSRARLITMAHLLTWGNAYFEIQFNSSMRPVALWPLLPDRTEACSDRADDGSIIKTFVTRINRVERVVLQDYQVLHISGLGFDGFKGYSPISMMRQSIGTAMATEEFAARFFGNGARPGGVLSHPGQLSQPAQDRLTSSWQSKFQGAENAHRLLVLEEGMSYTPTGLPPEDVQFVQQRKMQRTEIAAIFGVPPHLIQDLERATFANIEQQSIEFIMYTLRPWFVFWEEEFNNKLFQQDDIYCEINARALLRGDMATRSAFNQSAIQNGYLTRNEVREEEGYNPIDGLDVPLQPVNMVPAGWTPPPAAPQPPPTKKQMELEINDGQAQRLAA